MKKEINPEDTSRASAFKMWMSSSMLMVTIFKTIDITRVVKVSMKNGGINSCDIPFDEYFREYKNKK